MSTQTLLVVDDSEDVHALLDVRLKQEGLVLHHAQDGTTGLRMARELRPDIILLDVEMPDVSGFEVCRALKAHADTSAIPVVFLTGSNASFVKVEAFDMGAVDYITKPFDAAELRARVRAALRTKRYLDMLALRAEIDGLTGLFNRRNFDRHVAEMLAAAKHGNGRLGLVMLDIDHFKSINDKHGHPFGDRVIQLLGEVLATTVRSEDRAFRYGGEEFAVLAADANLDGAMAAAHRISSKLAGMRCEHNREIVSVTVSCGVASTEIFTDLQSVTPEALLAAADNALYEAKRAGRNRACAAAQRTPATLTAA